MKSKFAIIAASAALLTAGNAIAADAVAPPPAPIVPPAATGFAWDGFYAGANLGYNWGEAQNGDGDTIGVLDANGEDVSFDDIDGALGGAQVGYNAQMGTFVLGAEADLQISAASQTVDFGAPLGDFTIEQDYLGTVRGRVGATFGNALAYVTGGLAYGQITTSVENPIATDPDQSNVHFGYAVGAGVEYAFADNISVKGEYLYTDLGSQDYSDFLPSYSADDELQLDSHSVRVGLNLHF